MSHLSSFPQFNFQDVFLQLISSSPSSSYSRNSPNDTNTSLNSIRMCFTSSKYIYNLRKNTKTEALLCRKQTQSFQLIVITIKQAVSRSLHVLWYSLIENQHVNCNQLYSFFTLDFQRASIHDNKHTGARTGRDMSYLKLHHQYLYLNLSLGWKLFCNLAGVNVIID